MPTIPAQNLPSVAPAGATGVFQRVEATPADFGALSAQAGQGVARAVEGAGDVAARIAMEQQAEANRAAASDAEIAATKLLDNLQYHPETGYMARKGKDAVDALPEASTAAEKVRSDALGQIQNPAVRKMIDPIITRAVRGVQKSMSAHAMQENRAWQLSSATTLAETIKDSGALTYNDDYKWGETIGGLKTQAAVIARLKGEGDDGRKAIEQKFIDAAWKDRLEAWRMHDPVAAMAKFQENADAISPTVRVTLGHQLFMAAEPVLAAKLNAMGGPAIPASPSVPEVKDGALPRGIRNNNPGNIQRSDIQWEGKIDGHDPRYESFDTPEAGIAALAQNLRSYEAKGINTVERIIGRWAPATENDTAAYIATVAKELGVKPNEGLKLSDPKLLIGLTKAIIKHENGRQPYTDEQLVAGVSGKLPKRADFADVTPADAANMMTGDPVVDRLPQDWKMKVIGLARTQAKQDQTQLRESVKYRFADDLAAYERGETPPNPVSGSELMRAFGQEHGARLIQQVTEAQQYGLDVRAVATMPASEQAALLAQRAPKPGEGYEFAVKRQESLTRAIEQVNKAREQDPATFVLQNSSGVMAAYRDMANAKKPEERAAAAQAYAAAALAEQSRLEIAAPKILPKNYVAEIARRFAQPAGKDGEGVDVANVMRGIVNEWGRFWPTVGKELAKSIPPGAVVIGLGVQPEAEQLIGEALRMKPEALKQGIPEPDLKDLKERVRTAFEPLQKSLRYIGGGQETYDNYADTAEALAIRLMQQGMKPKDAAAKAFESTVGFKYEFEDEWRVPKAALGGSATVMNIRTGAGMARYDIAEKGELAVPATPGAARPEDVAKQWRETVKSNGFWITAPGDGGLALYVKSGLGAQPVLDARGQPIVKSWQELNAAGSSVAPAFGVFPQVKGRR